VIEVGGDYVAWWFWPVFLFIFTLLIGIIAPVSGVGGGSIFVPLATLLTPFNIDFIRGTGLVMAVTAAVSSAPYLLKKGLANIRLYAVIAPIIVVTSVIGGIVGLWVSNAIPNGKSYVKLLLGIVMLLVSFIMIISKRLEFPEVRDEDVDSLSRKLGMVGEWYEPSLERIVQYKIKNLPVGMFMFAVIGFIAEFITALSQILFLMSITALAFILEFFSTSTTVLTSSVIFPLKSPMNVIPSPAYSICPYSTKFDA